MHRETTTNKEPIGGAITSFLSFRWTTGDFD